MPGPTNTLLIEGSFEELADELAHYIDEIQKKQNPDSANTQAEIAPLLEKEQRDEALKKLVTASEVLNTAPEKGAYTFNKRLSGT
jgi:translation initiation factor 3 subunit M